jgi:hypothetical protein
MQIRKYNVELIGITPLLMHWDNIEWADTIGEKRDQVKRDDKANFAAGDDRCPPDTWKGCLYNDEEFVVVPADNLRTCLVKAGAKVTIQKNETFKKAMASGITFDSVFATFLVNGKRIKFADCMAVKGTFSEQAAAVKKLGFRLMLKRAAVNGKKHVRVRPEFAKWTVETAITVTEDRITDKALRDIWVNAGLYIGLCDWRPDSPKSPGPYGKFSVEVQSV